jgi:ABC-type multidrug transport system fused ATPase/permease subunit
VLFGVGALINFSVSQGFVRDLRAALLDQMNRLSPDYHEQTPTGEKITCVEYDVDEIAGLGADSVNQSIRAVLFFVLNLAMMAHLSRTLTLVIVPLLPLFAITQRVFRTLMQKRSDEARTEVGTASSVLNEHLSAVPQIQLLGAEDLSAHRSAIAWSSMLRAQWAQRRAQIGYGVAVGAIMAAAITVVLCYGSNKVAGGALTLGGLVAFYTFVTRVFEPISLATDIYARMQSVGSCIRRVRSLLELTPTVADTGKLDEVTAAPTFFVNGLDIRDVHFAYNGKPVLRGVSFSIGPGERVAIIGSSGSGKSTMARLLVRFADPLAGEILLEEEELARYTLSALRRTVCYVPQLPVLFDGTVRDNLLYGNPGANRAQIDDAVGAACLDAVLAKLPSGLETVLGPGAFSLSGGERQRLAVARALLRNSYVLIFDEATSALDLPTENAFFANLSRCYADRAVVIISHRISSLTWVDRMVLLNHGVVAAIGSHPALYRSCGLYRSLFDASAQDAWQR